MKIILIGYKGTIGKVVHQQLSKNHEVVCCGRTSGDYLVDITSPESITGLFEKVGSFDAVVCTVGVAGWGPLSTMDNEKFFTGINSKLMGQVNLVLIGQKYIADSGSFTLISGILADDPVMGASNAAMVNGGLHSFVKAAGRELTKDVRINVVSPGMVKDSAEKFEKTFAGHVPVEMHAVAMAFVKSVEGNSTGEVLRVYP